MTQNNFSLEVVAPVFQVTDMKRTLSYYSECLFFNVGFEWADDPGESIRYAVLQQNDTELHLTSVDSPRGSTAYFFAANVKGYYEAVMASGAEIVHKLEDQSWKMREFEVRDPDGNALVFGEHLSRIKEA